MIELPDGVHPNSATPALVDFGGVMRPATGAKILRLNRGGNRYRVAMTLPVRTAENARLIISDLLSAKAEGLRVEYPLQNVDQGLPGNFVVNGAGQAGNTIALRGGTPHYAAKKGFWLTIYDATGQGYLHNVKSQAVANVSGTMTIVITPNLRMPFADGARVNFTNPTIEGLVDSDATWELALGGLTDGISFVIEEAA
ncbi:MAG: hypothetical protein ACSLE1_01995 [Sphingobium sp.]